MESFRGQRIECAAVASVRSEGYVWRTVEGGRVSSHYRSAVTQDRSEPGSVRAFQLRVIVVLKSCVLMLVTSGTSVPDRLKSL